MINRDTAEHYSWGAGCDGWHLAASGGLSVIEERMPPGASELLHYHEFAQQFFYILAGTASFERDGGKEVLSAGEGVHVPAATLHRIANRQKTDLTMLVISTPPSHGDRIDIVDFAEEHTTAVKKLNVEWLEKYFRVEPNDIVQLNHPGEEIIGRGGFIFCASYRGEIVGTVALMKVDDTVYELAKMAVTENAQGHSIGSMLIRHCVAVAKRNSMKKLVLYSNTTLKPAMHLYRKHGFAEVALEPGHYQRANVKMERIL